MKESPEILPIGKLPPELLTRLLSAAPVLDERVVVGPGVGLDCAVVDMGSTLLVYKSDPITFTADEIGWYAVQVNANDIATSGAVPAWFMTTLLLPESDTTSELVEQISQQVYQACHSIGVSVIGGHSEITSSVRQPIIVGTMVGEVTSQDLVTPSGARPGDSLLLTKGVPIEAVSILAREYPHELQGILSASEIKEAHDFLYQPGISVLKDAQVATQAGQVTAMHDPTEGGLAAALWELAQACEHRLVIDPQEVFVPPLAGRICAVFDIDPLAAIASGALLLTTPPEDAQLICRVLEREGIPCRQIGQVEKGPPEVWVESHGSQQLLPYPQRDEVARLIEKK